MLVAVDMVNDFIRSERSPYELFDYSSVLVSAAAFGICVLFAGPSLIFEVQRLLLSPLFGPPRRSVYGILSAVILGYPFPIPFIKAFPATELAFILLVLKRSCKRLPAIVTHKAIRLRSYPSSRPSELH